ncbi:MFS transporter [Novosphingobium sp. RD2P27]|uniref:MFS transporter n=1 Tax=Novosphingobium kalidii TaxID=3230299 RepID=A0ABV2D2Z3_9SPHN
MTGDDPLGVDTIPRKFIAGWRQVAICFVLLSASGMVASTYSLIAVPLYREFAPSRMVLMLSMTAMAAVSAVLMLMLGNLFDRFSVRKLMVLGGFCLAAGYASISFTTSFNQVLVIFAVLMSLSNVLIGPLASTVLLSRWFERKRGRAIGVAIAGISAGGFLFPLIIQGFLDAYQWREALRLLSLVIAVLTIPAALLVVDRPADRGLHPDGMAEPSEQARAEMASTPISARTILTDPAFWMIAAAVATVTSGMKGMITNLAPLALDAGIPASDAAYLISIFAGSSFVAKMLFATFADKLGPRALMFASLGGFAVGLACLTQAHLGFGAIALGVAIVGLAGGLMVPTESYLAPRVFGQRAVGRAMGLLSGTILIALLSTPPLFGFIFDVTGSYTAIFWTFSGLAVAALFMIPAIRLHPKQRDVVPLQRETPEESSLAASKLVSGDESTSVQAHQVPRRCWYAREDRE